jgi:thiol-disulfide isomerase/thioredoxin
MTSPLRRRDTEKRKVKNGKWKISDKRFSRLHFPFSIIFLYVSVVIICFVFLSVENLNAQARKKPRTKAAVKKVLQNPTPVSLNLPKVTQIDGTALGNLLKRENAASKPLLVNFWATWCDPCREEFPELVKIDAEYQEKIDFITVSLDDLAEINRDVPKFLLEMKSTMPAYLLKTENEETAIASVSKDWQGGLPFTILLNSKGETAYYRQGKIKPDILRAEIDKILPTETTKQTQ